jgi:hypothetical protein
VKQQYWKGLLVAAEYKRMQEVNRGQEQLEANDWRDQGPVRAVTLYKEKNKKKEGKTYSTELCVTYMEMNDKYS